MAVAHPRHGSPRTGKGAGRNSPLPGVPSSPRLTPLGGGGFLDWDDMPTPATMASRSPPRRRWTTIPRNASASTNCRDTLPFCPSNLSPISRLVLRHSGTIRPDQSQLLSAPPSAAKVFCDSRPGSAHHPTAARAGTRFVTPPPTPRRRSMTRARLRPPPRIHQNGGQISYHTGCTCGATKPRSVGAY